MQTNRSGKRKTEQIPNRSIDIVTHQLAAAFRPLRQTRSLPSPAESLNQQHCARHTTSQDIDRRDLIRESGTLWGEQYSRRLSDVLTVQQEIAANISEKLRKLSGVKKERITKRYTDNSEAYQAFLKGRNHWGKPSEDDLKRAIHHFEEAVRLDPSYAPALCSTLWLPQCGQMTSPSSDSASVKIFENVFLQAWQKNS